MMRFLTDENFNNDIPRSVMRQFPDADFVRVQDVGLMATPDPIILDWALHENRILLTHDYKTILPLAKRLISDGQPIPGIFFTKTDAPIGEVVLSLIYILECSEQDEWTGYYHFLPL